MIDWLCKWNPMLLRSTVQNCHVRLNSIVLLPFINYDASCSFYDCFVPRVLLCGRTASFKKMPSFWKQLINFSLFLSLLWQTFLTNFRCEVIKFYLFSQQFKTVHHALYLQTAFWIELNTSGTLRILVAHKTQTIMRKLTSIKSHKFWHYMEITFWMSQDWKVRNPIS